MLNQPLSPLSFFSLEKNPAVCLLLAHMQNWIFRAQAAATFEVLIKHNIYLRKRSSSLGFQISEVWKLIPCCSSPLSFPPLFKHKANFGDGKKECSIFSFPPSHCKGNRNRKYRGETKEEEARKKIAQSSPPKYDSVFGLSALEREGTFPVLATLAFGRKRGWRQSCGGCGMSAGREGGGEEADAPLFLIMQIPSSPPDPPPPASALQSRDLQDFEHQIPPLHARR